jgi:hypothetical protein
MQIDEAMRTFFGVQLHIRNEEIVRQTTVPQFPTVSGEVLTDSLIQQPLHIRYDIQISLPLTKTLNAPGTGFVPSPELLEPSTPKNPETPIKRTFKKLLRDRASMMLSQMRDAEKIIIAALDIGSRVGATIAIRQNTDASRVLGHALLHAGLVGKSVTRMVAGALRQKAISAQMTAARVIPHYYENAVKLGWECLLDLYENNSLLIVDTGKPKGKYSSMVISNITKNRNVRTDNCIECSIEFQEVQLVTPPVLFGQFDLNIPNVAAWDGNVPEATPKVQNSLINLTNVEEAQRTADNTAFFEAQTKVASLQEQGYTTRVIRNETTGAYIVQGQKPTHKLVQFYTGKKYNTVTHQYVPNIRFN